MLANSSVEQIAAAELQAYAELTGFSVNQEPIP